MFPPVRSAFRGDAVNGCSRQVRTSGKAPTWTDPSVSVEEPSAGAPQVRAREQSGVSRKTRPVRFLERVPQTRSQLACWLCPRQSPEGIQSRSCRLRMRAVSYANSVARNRNARGVLLFDLDLSASGWWGRPETFLDAGVGRAPVEDASMFCKGAWLAAMRG